MRIGCLMPIYGRPTMAGNALACYLAQDYPSADRKLFILDDADQIPSQDHGDWELWSVKEKMPTLVAKYNFLAAKADEWGADAYCVWEDDDIYFYNHLTAHARVLKHDVWSHPYNVWSLYTGRLALEGAAGRFHAALAMRANIMRSIGCWGTTHKPDFDQQLIAKLRSISEPGRPDALMEPTYVYRWGSTHSDHGSARIKGPDDATWYTETPISEPGRVDTIIPKMDEETARVTAEALLTGTN